MRIIAFLEFLSGGPPKRKERRGFLLIFDRTRKLFSRFIGFAIACFVIFLIETNIVKN